MTTWASSTRWSSTAAACSPSRRMRSSPQVLVTAASCHPTSRGPAPRGGQASRLPRAMSIPLTPTGPCPCTCITAARTSWSRWPAAAWRMARLRAAAASGRSARRASPQRRSSSRWPPLPREPSPPLPREPSPLAITPLLALTLTTHPHRSPLTTHDPTFTLALALTATSHREQWLAVNKCSGSQPALGPAGAQCTTGTGCAANATLCVHEQCYHQMWARSFPAADAVVEFFARAVRACPPLSEPHAPWPCLTVTGHASWGRQVRRHLPLP